MEKITKFIGAVAIGYGSIVFYSGIINAELPRILITGFGAVVAATGILIVVADYGSKEE